MRSGGEGRRTLDLDDRAQLAAVRPAPASTNDRVRAAEEHSRFERRSSFFDVEWISTPRRARELGALPERAGVGVESIRAFRADPCP